MLITSVATCYKFSSTSPFTRIYSTIQLPHAKLGYSLPFELTDTTQDKMLVFRIAVHPALGQSQLAKIIRFVEKQNSAEVVGHLFLSFPNSYNLLIHFTLVKNIFPDLISNINYFYFSFYFPFDYTS